MPLSSVVDLAAGGIAAGAAYGAAKYTAKQARFAAHENRQFQERLSSTAVQRRRADLEAAGFNPLLAITQGQGASTPGGATAQVPDFSQAVGSGIQGMAAAAQVRNTSANTALAHQRIWMNKPEEIKGRVAAFTAKQAMRAVNRKKTKKPYPNWKAGKRSRQGKDLTVTSDKGWRKSKATPGMFGGTEPSTYPEWRRNR